MSHTNRSVFTFLRLVISQILNDTETPNEWIFIPPTQPHAFSANEVKRKLNENQVAKYDS